MGFKDVQQMIFHFWSFICLYSLAVFYLLIEFNRRWKLFGQIVHLNLDDDVPDLGGHVSIITGGSRGIGLETAKQLLAKGCRVIIATSVKPDGMKELMAKIDATLTEKNGQLELWHLNLSSMKSVIEFVDRFKKSGSNLNILINNAGVMYVPFSKTENGFETHFAVNYLGHCLLTWHLLPILNRSGEQLGRKSRVVNVSSSTHFAKQMKLNDLHGFELYSPFHSYAQSKLAQIMFTYTLNDYILRMQKRDQLNWISVNCLHPGVVKTELYEHVKWVQLMPWIADLLFRTPKDGAETVVYTAAARQMDGVGGKYLEDCAIVKSSKDSCNKLKQVALWLKTWHYLEPWIYELGQEQSPLANFD